LPLYKDLASIADRVLRPGGSLITYIGQYALLEIGQLILNNSSLRYWWQLYILLQGPSLPRHFDRQIVVGIKPLLWFAKGDRPINLSFPISKVDGKKNLPKDLIVSKTPDKRFHDWGQSPVEAEYIMKFLTAENDLVLDPFLGGGATAIAAMNLHRRFIGMDIDPKALELTRANLRLNVAQSVIAK
jgi:hypothetical protein